MSYLRVYVLTNIMSHVMYWEDAMSAVPLGDEYGNSLCVE